MAWLWLSSKLMRLFSEFFQTDKFVASLNATFIGLIPKKANAENILHDYGMTTDRLVLRGAFTSHFQTFSPNNWECYRWSYLGESECFRWGRQILDGELIVNELTDYRIKSRNPKLDIEKAYDLGVSDLCYEANGLGEEMDFIYSPLHFFDFLCSISCILHCISSTSFAVLVNSSPTDFSSASRGLCQGDPLSSSVFSMEVFTRMLCSAQQVTLKGFQLAKGIQLPLMSSIFSLLMRQLSFVIIIVSIW